MIREMKDKINQKIQYESEKKDRLNAEKEGQIQSRFQRIETEMSRMAQRKNVAIEAWGQRKRSPNHGNGQRRPTSSPRSVVRDESTRRSEIEYILQECRGDNNPMQYLNQIRQYWEAVQPLDDEVHYLLERSISGPAGNWLQVVKGEVNSFRTFESKLLKRYWEQQA